MIEDVIIKKLERRKDERGWLCEVWRRDERGHAPAMAYISKTEPGVARGPHEHREQADCFIFTGPGNFRMHLWENRRGKPGLHELETMDVGEDNPCMIIVPPGVVHGYKCISAEPGYYVNLPSHLYKGEGKQDEIDEIRWEQDPDSPFKIA